jgi:hypothetical protein
MQSFGEYASFRPNNQSASQRESGKMKSRTVLRRPAQLTRVDGMPGLGFAASLVSL